MGSRRLANVVAAVVAVGFVAGAVAYHRSLGALADVGRPAPDWTLPDLQGRPFRLAELRGRPVLINFWTTWCDPCREEIPGLDSFSRRFADRLVVVGVNVREPLPTVRDFVKEFAMSYPVVRDADGKVADRYRVRGYPESWLLDADGVARRFWPGPLTFEVLEQAYEELTGTPIAVGSRGGPLAAGEKAVGLVRSGRWLVLASSRRLVLSEVGSPESPGAWRPVALPQGAGGEPITALSSWPVEEAALVALGSDLWLLYPASGRWEPFARALGAPVRALAAVPAPQGKGVAVAAWLAGRGLTLLERPARGSAARPQAAGSVPAPSPLAGGLSPDVPVSMLAFVREGEGGEAGLMVGGEAGLVHVAVSGTGAAGSLALGTVRSVLGRPVFAVTPDPAAPGRTWWAATNQGIYRFSWPDGAARVVDGSPVRRFRGVAALPAGGLLAVADDGDLYEYRPGPGGAEWVLVPLPREERGDARGRA